MNEPVAISTHVSSDVREWMRRRLKDAGLRVMENPGGAGVLDAAGLAQMLPQVVGLIIGPGSISRELLASATRLRAISKFGVGVDAIDLDAATSAGIGVTSTPGANADAVADLTLALVISLARQLPAAVCGLSAGGSHRPVGWDLAHKTMGLLGFGATGQAVARRASACGMRVAVLDRPSVRRWRGDVDIEVLGIEELLACSDVLSIHIPLTSETQGLIGAAEMRAMPTGSYLVNTARGGIVDEAALFDALDSGHLAGAALDVFDPQPPGGPPLLAMKSVLATPHIGGATQEAHLRAGMEAVENLSSLLRAERPRNLVNPDVDLRSV